MARLQQRRPENRPGDFYVDSSCIDCDTCRWMAPETFSRIGNQSAVTQQPLTDGDRRRALSALLACPTASIGTLENAKALTEVQSSFPQPITAEVFHCGYHSSKSFGAASYLIRRSEGNVLVDSPRFTTPLVRRLEALGGIRWLYLTHQDDVADHQRFQAHFGCDRLLHADDVTAQTAEVEIQLQGNAPYLLAGDLTIIPAPGHSKGHTVLLFRNQVLFSGDHLYWSQRLGHLAAFRDFCWYSFSQQIQSMQQLLDYRFEWVLPGHGRRFHADADTMRSQLEWCIAWMQSVA
jgi:ferredoxin